MRCKHCGEDICDTCWKKRADILFERNDLRDRVAELEKQRDELVAALDWHAELIRVGLAQAGGSIIAVRELLNRVSTDMQHRLAPSPKPARVTPAGSPGGEETP